MNYCFRSVARIYRKIFRKISLVLRLNFLPTVSRCEVLPLSSNTIRLTKFVRNSLNKWSDRRRDLHLTKHNTHKSKISTISAWLDPAVSLNLHGECFQQHISSNTEVKFLSHYTIYKIQVEAFVSNSFLVIRLINYY